MKRTGAYLLVCIILLMSCSRGPRIIPRGKMAKIYAEMYLLDAHLAVQSGSVRNVADTSLVYEPIFKKYGYDSDDFQASVEEYLKDAGRYSRMLKQAVLMVEEETKALKAEKNRQDAILLSIKNSRRFAPANIYLMDTLHIDSLWCMDSIYAFDFQKGLDTAYYGPRIVVWADTVGRHKKDSVDVAL